MVMVCCFLSIGVILLSISLAIDSLAGVFVSFCFLGSGYGGGIPCNSAFILEYFGKEHYSENFGAICSAGMLSSVMGSYILGHIITVTDSYLAACPFFFLFVVTAILLQHRLTIHTRKIGQRKAQQNT